MIEIKSIYIDGYKNLHELNIELKKINAFLSLNNYGKSNVLSGIMFGFDFITKPTNIKDVMMRWQSGIPYNKSDLSKSFKFGIVLESDKFNNAVIKYEFEFAWGKSQLSSGKIISEKLKIKEEDSQKYCTYINRDLDNSMYKTSKTGRCDKEISIKNNELIINKILAFDDLYYLEVIEELNNLSFFVDRHFDARGLYNEIPIIEKGYEESSPFNDGSIARSLYYLEKKHKNKYDLIVNTLKDFFPYILDLEIKEFKVSDRNLKVKINENAPFELADSIYVLMVTDKFSSSPIRFDYMSDGVKRILSLLTYMTLADLRDIPLIGIEEPENSIHPGLLKKYIEAIDGFLDHSKVIITSHSPFLIDCINLNSLYIGLPNKYGRAIFKGVSNNLVTKVNNVAEEMGITSGQYIFSIFNGDNEEDLALLRKYLENE